VTIFLTHNKTKLAFHTLRDVDGPALLLLHGLGEHSPRSVPAEAALWPGSVFALDFTGHGESSIPAGGGYTAENLMGDADAALAVLGRATLLGRGLGAYVALLLCGARPKLVRGAVLCDGPGLAGGGDHPGPLVVRGVPERDSPPDPFALVELAADLRPAQYAATFAAIAGTLSGLDPGIAVAAKARPDWLSAVLAQPRVAAMTVGDALDRFGARENG
jgi:pimeloyl-ACP methyl ester carboxylesterase